MAKYVCDVCGYVYDPVAGDPDNGIASGTAFQDLPDDWTIWFSQMPCGTKQATDSEAEVIEYQGNLPNVAHCELLMILSATIPLCLCLISISLQLFDPQMLRYYQ